MNSMINNLPNIYFTALPQPGQSKRVHRLYREKLKKSLLSLIHSAEKTLNQNYDHLCQKYESINLEQRFSPRLHYLHHHLQNKMKSGDVSSVKSTLSILDQTPSTEIYSPILCISSGISQDWEIFAAEEVNKSKATNAAGEKTKILFSPIADISNAKTSLEEVLELIQSHDTVLKEQLDEYMTHVKIFDGKAVVGMTDVRFFGAIFLRTPSTKEDPIAYFMEHLIHETSHLHLNAIMAHDPLILNSPDELYPAPIRLDRRPMYGVFHATYVLSRIVRFFRLAAKIFHDRKSFTTSLNITERQFHKGYEIVKSYARCTEAGNRIVESLIPTSISLTKS